jgi:hypothetical protein
MMQGTTPTHIFKLPFDVSAVKAVQIIYAQNDTEVLTKDINDCELEGNTISTKLTQDETLQLDHRYNVQIQIRVLTAADDALASDVICVKCDRCLSDEVL